MPGGWPSRDCAVAPSGASDGPGASPGKRVQFDFIIWVVEDYPFHHLSGKLAHGVLDLALEPPDLMTKLACS